MYILSEWVGILYAGMSVKSVFPPPYERTYVERVQLCYKLRLTLLFNHDYYQTEKFYSKSLPLNLNVHILDCCVNWFLADLPN